VGLAYAFYRPAQVSTKKQNTLLPPSLGTLPTKLLCFLSRSERTSATPEDIHFLEEATSCVPVLLTMGAPEIIANGAPAPEAALGKLSLENGEPGSVFRNYPGFENRVVSRQKLVSALQARSVERPKVTHAHRS
jgi:hypothetical protein